MRSLNTLTKLACLCIVVGGGITLWWQHQNLVREREQNRILRQQIEELSAHIDEITLKNARLPGLVPTNPANPGAAEEPSRELLRLRGDVTRLRLVEKEVEQSRVEAMRAAHARLTNAEIELARLTRLHSENLVSARAVNQAWFRVDSLKAEAKGDTIEAARVRLRQAETELAQAEELYRESLISQAEYEQAVRKVDSLRTGTE